MNKYLCLFSLLSASINALAQRSALDQARQETMALESRKPSIARDTLLALSLYECARLYSESKTPDSAIIYINRADTLSKRHQWKTGEGLQEYRTGNYYMTLGLATVATEHFLKALKCFQESKDTWRQSQTYNYLGVNTVYNDFSDTANVLRGIKLLEKAYHLARKGGFARAKAAALINIIQAYEKIGEYRKALYVAQLMPENFAGSNPLFPWTTMAVCYAHTENSKEYHRYRDSIATRKNLSAYERYYISFEFGAMELHFKNVIKAEHYALEMRQAALELQADKKVLEAEILLHQVYKAINNPNLALWHLEQVRALEKKLSETTSKQAVEELQLKYNTQRIQADNDRLQQTRTQNFLLAGLGLLAVFTAYAFRSNRQLRQKNREISEALLQGQTLERKRVAADLHDNLGSTLSALQWSLEVIDKTKLTKPEQDVYATLSQQVSQAHNDVRLLSHNLLPDELAKQGLAATLRNLVEKMNRNTPVHFSLTGADSLPRLDRQTEFELYSICLELLNNVLKHAQASETSIDIQQTNNTLHLTINDNGTGIDRQQSTGRGLQNIATRVESLAGTWVTDSPPGKGTQNRIIVPLRMPARASSQT